LLLFFDVKACFLTVELLAAQPQTLKTSQEKKRQMPINNEDKKSSRSFQETSAFF
jgi:hypothetical protein